MSKVEIFLTIVGLLILLLAETWFCGKILNPWIDKISEKGSSKLSKIINDINKSLSDIGVMPSENDEEEIDNEETNENVQ